MAATIGCEAWAAWVGGRLVGAAGYSMAFVVLIVVLLMSIPLAPRMQRPVRARTSG